MATRNQFFCEIRDHALGPSVKLWGNAFVQRCYLRDSHRGRSMNFAGLLSLRLDFPENNPLSFRPAVSGREIRLLVTEAQHEELHRDAPARCFQSAVYFNLMCQPAVSPSRPSCRRTKVFPVHHAALWKMQQIRRHRSRDSRELKSRCDVATAFKEHPLLINSL